MGCILWWMAGGNDAVEENNVSRNANNQGNTHEETNMFYLFYNMLKCKKLLKVPIRKKVKLFFHTHRSLVMVQGLR